MKITIESNDNKISVERNTEEISEVMELVAQALLGYGFHPDSVEGGFIEKAGRYEKELQED